jgi:glycosyltransferase involved in cell wall biosynthesis
MEEKEVKKFVSVRKGFVLGDFPRALNFNTNLFRVREKKLRILFVSRISKKKNLDFAIDILNNLNLEFEFNIIGNPEDHKYLNFCLNKINKNIKYNFLGHQEPEEISKLFSINDLFLFPTKGENFGHVIFESLYNGCITIISNLTPWNSISSFAYVLDDFNLLKYSDAIMSYYNLSSEEKQYKSKQAINFAKTYIDQLKSKNLFKEILSENKTHQ